MIERIVIRFASKSDARRLVADGVITGPPPAGMTWEQRIAQWFAEQARGYRAVLVAQERSRLVGLVQLVFKFPEGRSDPEAADGKDTAMMDLLRVRPTAAPQLTEHLINEVEGLARKRGIKTLTFRVSMQQTQALAQARKWGFKEFRIMPEGSSQHVFFRKSL